MRWRHCFLSCLGIYKKSERCWTCLSYRTKIFLLFPAEPARMRMAETAETAETAEIQGPAWATLQLLVPLPRSWETPQRRLLEASGVPELSGVLVAPGVLPLMVLLLPAIRINGDLSSWLVQPGGEVVYLGAYCHCHGNPPQAAWSRTSGSDARPAGNATA